MLVTEATGGDVGLASEETGEPAGEEAEQAAEAGGPFLVGQLKQVDINGLVKPWSA